MAKTGKNPTRAAGDLQRAAVFTRSGKFSRGVARQKNQLGKWFNRLSKLIPDFSIAKVRSMAEFGEFPRLAILTPSGATRRWNRSLTYTLNEHM
jgi:hypothetical protein